MTDATEDAKATSQALRVAETLKRMIINNDLPPGSNLLESEIGEMLGVSRTPIREAAVVLEARGLIGIRPRHGIQVLPLTVGDMEEIYDILIELEPLAAARAAERGQSDETLAPLETCLGRMEAALDRDDRTAWAEADGEFHSRLVALSGSRRLTQVIGMFSDQVHRARLITLHMRPVPHDSNRNHRLLVDAIRRGAADEARDIHREHRTKAKMMIVGLLQQHGLVRF